MENQSHCDFVKLRNMLIRSHMHDLKDVTCDVHYENYRAQCIQDMTRYVRLCVYCRAGFPKLGPWVHILFFALALHSSFK